MSEKSSRTAWAAPLLASVLAAGFLSAGAAQAVTGSEVPTGLQDAVVKLAIGDEANSRACTGVLIDEWWVATAASCFATTAGQQVPAGQPGMKATVALAGGQTFTVTALEPREDRDLVLARLSLPAKGATKAKVGTSVPAAGTDLTAVGYGRTKSDWVPGKPHSGVFTVNTSDTTTLAITGKATDTICQGDTGGPLLNAANELIAINSKSWQGGCLGASPTETRTGALSVRTDDLGPWIDMTRGSVPTAQWKLTGQSGNVVPSEVGAFPATATNITWPTATIEGRSTTYAAFAGRQSTITTGTSVIDTRDSFTLTTWIKPGPGGAVVSQDNNRNSSFAIFADPDSKMWQFAIARGDSDTAGYDWANKAVNSAATYTPDAWQHVTATYNAATGLMSLYVNGTLASTGHHTASLGAAPVGPLVMGRYKERGSADFYHQGLTGGISNLAVYPFAVAPTAPGSTGKIKLTNGTNICADRNTGRIQLWECNEINGGEAQQFAIRGDGTIRNQNLCMDAANAGTTNGTRIQIVGCHDHPAQQFLPRADGSIYNPASGRCVDASNMQGGTQLQLWDCNQSSPQKWTIPTLATAPLPAPRW